jgi:tetratricopeptide (TPR) repeat protein
MNLNAADPYFYGRQYDRAIEHLQRLLEQEPRFFPALFHLGRAYVQKEMYDEAIDAFEKAAQFSGNREGKSALAHTYALAGQEDQARNILKELLASSSGRYVASPMVALVYFGLGEADRAFEWLRKGVQERSYWNIFLHMDPVYDAVRDDSRFRKLLKEVGFSTGEKLRARAS